MTTHPPDFRASGLGRRRVGPGRFGRFIRGLAALAVVIGVAAATAPAAQAAEYLTGEWGTYNGASTFWGNLKVGGVYGLCIDPGTTPPDSLGDANARKVCGTLGADAKPDKTSQIAWLLARHLNDTDDKTLVSLSQFARDKYHTGIPVAYPARYNELVAEAAQAGPKDGYAQEDLPTPSTTAITGPTGSCSASTWLNNPPRPRTILPRVWTAPGSHPPHPRSDAAPRTPVPRPAPTAKGTTPRVPNRARLPLLPSGPGGVQRDAATRGV